MHAHQHVGIAIRFAHHQGHMLLAAHLLAVAVQREYAMARRQPASRNTIDDALGASPPGDQIADRDQRQAMCPREGLELRTARHAAVVVDDLDEYTTGLQAGEAGEVHGRLGVPRTRQHAAWDRAQREHMPRPVEITGLRRRIDEGTQRCRTVGRRDAGARAMT